jgi:hypothetical protein
MTPIVITISPCQPRPFSGKWAGRFEARLGERLLCVSRQPLLDSARILLAQGHSPDATIVMRSAGSQVDSPKARLSTAAQLTVNEDGPRFERWRPHPRAG